MTGTAVPLLALAGGAGSGKTTLARALAARMRAAVVHLDDCYHTDIRHAPCVPAFDGHGHIVDFSDPRSIDPARVAAAVDRHRTAELVVVEGVFALALDSVRTAASRRVYVETPADIRLARKVLRGIGEGRDAACVLRGYLERGRAAHDRYVALTRTHADLVVDGTGPVGGQVEQIRSLLAQAPAAASSGDAPSTGGRNRRGNDGGDQTPSQGAAAAGLHDGRRLPERTSAAEQSRGETAPPRRGRPDGPTAGAPAPGAGCARRYRA